MSLITSPSTAWELALETHLISLSPAERATFLAPTSADECIAAVCTAYNRRRRAGFAKVLDALRPLIEPLKRFEGALDVLVQTNGAMLSPIWGPIRMVVTVVGDHWKSVEKLTQILQRVAGLLPRVQTYEELFMMNENAKRTIGTIYADFIDFCARVVHYHTLPCYKFVLHDFNKEFEEVWERINYDCQQMDWTANATSIEETKRCRGTANDRYDDKQRTALQRWLSPSNVEDDFLRYRRQLIPSSCDLLFRSSQFVAWETGTDSSILRVAGYPGAGKTYFASASCERLQISGKRLAYFFCKSGYKDREATLNVLRTLLSQIIKLEKSADGILIPLYQDSGHMSADSISEIEHLFNELLASGLPTIHLVIDALDELTDRSQLFEAFQSFLRQSSTVVKILVTSRNETDIVQSFAPYPSLQITFDMTHKPIERYLAKRLSECYTLADQNLKGAIWERVIYGANGLWLYAKLMIDAVTELPSAAAIERQLRQLPNGLSEMYFQILERHADKLSSWQFEWAQQLFLWVDTEDYLWLLAKGEKLSIDTSILSVIFQAVNEDGDSPMDPLSVAKVLGGPLMEVITPEKGDPLMEIIIPENRGSAGIDYVHLSAKQYIMSVSDAKGPYRPPRLLKARRLRQLFRGRTAVWYFGASIAGRTNLDIYRGKPDTACNFWWGTPHPVLVYGLWDAVILAILPDDLDSEEIATAQDLCELLIRFLTSDDCLVWVESGIIVNYSGRWPHLLENVLKVLGAVSTSPISNHQFFERYLQARLDFFWHFSHVLAATGPKSISMESDVFERILCNSRFEVPHHSLPLHQKILAIGKKYEYLVVKA